MKCEQTVWQAEKGWMPGPPGHSGVSADLVFLFGGRGQFEDAVFLGSIVGTFPNAVLMGCTTAGEICDTEVLDRSLVCTAISFRTTRCRSHCVPIADSSDGYQVGRELAQKLNASDLRHVFVFSDGLNINGTELAHGLTDNLDSCVSLTGGLAADDDRFAQTYILCGGEPRSRFVSAAGIYGTDIRIGCGSLGGWDPFGPERLITRASGKVLYELDGMSALDLYRRYLGVHAAGLPATGLLFPLAIRIRPDAPELVRTILQINEQENSVTFAGDIPEGGYARLMKANVDRLIDGAVGAADQCRQALSGVEAEFALLISCVGRRMLLKQRVEEEVEGVKDVIGRSAVVTGFYSYGEIAPGNLPGSCELHNQTMTITTLNEI
ncbi:MAG TPA: FIST N-terminal domain-containing protein [Kiritimatiellia bacterium]|nr:FIST N-terminal domain-containing protein [Kiritimatiellia bacterium]